MPARPTLRRELLGAFALVFTGALIFFVLGIWAIFMRGSPPRAGTLWVMLLLLADVGVFTLFGRYLLRRRVIGPIERLVVEIEDIAAGDGGRVTGMGTSEFDRLSAAVNHMAERLISDQALLADNIRSLDETNRLLTEARDAMVHAEKMASVGRLSAGIAHEIGNPLGAILGYVGYVSRSVDEQSKELLAAAQREAERIDRIVRGLLDYARPRDTRSQAIDVNRVIVDTIELLRMQGRFTHVMLDVRLAPDLPTVMGDPYQLQQVFVNLMVNAIDALAETPEPRLEVTSETRLLRGPAHRPARRQNDPPGVDYSHRRRFATVGSPVLDGASGRAGRIVEIRFTDNGPGVPPDLLDQIFEPFVTTKPPGQGTGLGLAVSARLVETMGGGVRAESADGGGASFLVMLPASSDGASSIDA
ncbi:MAG: ATP-binding protein [Gemmatimonadetes bacterium]|nr:ATP-binding protein [Gemmatimonadota bacterium]